MRPVHRRRALGQAEGVDVRTLGLGVPVLADDLEAVGHAVLPRAQAVEDERFDEGAAGSVEFMEQQGVATKAQGVALERLGRDGRVEVVRLRPGVVFGPRSRWIADPAAELPLVGRIRVRTSSKEDLLRFWQEIKSQFQAERSAPSGSSGLSTSAEAGSEGLCAHSENWSACTLAQLVSIPPPVKLPDPLPLERIVTLCE